MGLFGKKKKKDDYSAKAREIERNIWELENKQILYLDKMKGVVAKQAEYKESARKETDKTMQRHYATLYLNAEREKEQYAYAINEISKEIVNSAKMSQLVDTRALFVELEKMQSLSLEEIGKMSESINASRKRRDTVGQLTSEAIDKALMHKTVSSQAALPADTLLEEWAQEERISSEQAKLAEAENAEKKEEAAFGEQAVRSDNKAEVEEDEADKFLREIGAGEV